MNGISLFAGSGIGDLIFKELIPDYRTVCYVEFNAYAITNLIKSIQAGFIDDAPIWDDITTFDTRPYQGMVDLVFGGFPCQPFSVAGKRKADGDTRNMWPDTLRIVSELRPRFCLLENVQGLLSATEETDDGDDVDNGTSRHVPYIHTIFGGLAEIGYDCEWDVVGAADVGANHRRKRLWILGQSRESK